MKVLVCGGRDYTDFEQVDRVLSMVHIVYEIDTLIQGGATGADELAKGFAESNNIPVITENADWSLGKKAGLIRNKAMLDKYKPDLVVAFPGGKGTANMINLAKRYNIKVLELQENRW